MESSGDSGTGGAVWISTRTASDFHLVAVGADDGLVGVALTFSPGALVGATSLTVSQMLAYAASQSNSGGSLWYGNVKSVQELAKNVFDAINNEVAFAP